MLKVPATKRLSSGSSPSCSNQDLCSFHYPVFLQDPGFFCFWGNCTRVQDLPLILGAWEIVIFRRGPLLSFPSTPKGSSPNFLCLLSEVVDHQLPGINGFYFYFFFLFYFYFFLLFFPFSSFPGNMCVFDIGNLSVRSGS